MLGDDPNGLYMDKRAAAAVREELVPLADVVTPNRLELAWLAERQVDGVASAIDAARALTGAATLATSVPAETRLANLRATGTQACVCHVARREHAPHGVGDLFSALVLGHHLAGVPLAEALARATSGVEIVLQTGRGCEELALVAALDRIVGAAPLRLEVY